MNEIPVNTIEFKTKASFQAFRRVYNKAVKDNKSEFMYSGYEFLTSYAKYVIEYVEPKFKKIK